MVEMYWLMTSFVSAPGCSNRFRLLTRQLHWYLGDLRSSELLYEYITLINLEKAFLPSASIFHNLILAHLQVLQGSHGVWVIHSDIKKLIGSYM